MRRRRRRKSKQGGAAGATNVCIGHIDCVDQGSLLNPEGQSEKSWSTGPQIRCICGPQMRGICGLQLYTICAPQMRAICEPRMCCHGMPQLRNCVTIADRKRVSFVVRGFVAFADRKCAPFAERKCVEFAGRNCTPLQAANACELQFVDHKCMSFTGRIRKCVSFAPLQPLRSFQPSRLATPLPQMLWLGEEHCLDVECTILASAVQRVLHYVVYIPRQNWTANVPLGGARARAGPRGGMQSFSETLGSVPLLMLPCLLLWSARALAAAFFGRKLRAGWVPADGKVAER
eukprot:gene22469-biopygen5753